MGYYGDWYNNTVIQNCSSVFNQCWHSCPNELVKHICVMNK